MTIKTHSALSYILEIGCDFHSSHPYLMQKQCLGNVSFDVCVLTIKTVLSHILQRLVVIGIQNILAWCRSHFKENKFLMFAGRSVSGAGIQSINCSTSDIPAIFKFLISRLWHQKGKNQIVKVLLDKLKACHEAS